ncbi:MAG: acyl--CoA ligase [bacterium]|nr:acyl--CoA ligase [bacterium]MCP5069833.1 acyl--CoA ligase [bacterium]
MPSLEEIETQLQGPGAPFEVGRAEVLGRTLSVFEQRMPSLRAVLEASVIHGDKECLLYEDRRISYAEHFRAVASVARTLAEDYGVGRGDRVAILAANCPEWIVAFWATTSLGAVAVGLNGWWARDEILFGLEDCDPRLLIGDRRRLERIRGVSLSFPVVEIESEFEALWNRDPDAPLPDQPIAEDDPAVIIYTSGTTGRPKGAVHSHRNIISLAGLQFFHGLRVTLSTPIPEPQATLPLPTVVLVNTPLFHASGLYTGAVTMLMSGATTVWMSGRFDPVRVMETIERERVTNWGPMGTMAHRVAFHPEVEDHDLSSLRGIGSGGAPMSPELQERIREVFPAASHSLGLGYGLTECTALATLIFGDELKTRPYSVGRALPTVEIEIRDEQGKPVPEGDEGGVFIRGPMVMLEYWRRPEATAEALIADGWLDTGDWGRLEEGYLYLNSRKRDLILRGGENVYPAEIELRLEAHPDVREVAIVGSDHLELGQEVKAVVVPEDGASPDPDALAEWVAETLAYFKVPSKWEFRYEALPRNATGKVMKHVLLGEAHNPFVEEA